MSNIDLLDRIAKNDRIWEALRTLMEEAKGYGEDRDGAANFILAKVVRNVFTSPDMAIASMESVKIGVVFAGLLQDPTLLNLVLSLAQRDVNMKAGA